MTDWMRLVHPETGGEQMAPDAPGVLEHFEARGWERRDLPEEVGDPTAVYETEPVVAEDEPTTDEAELADDTTEDEGDAE